MSQPPLQLKMSSPCPCLPQMSFSSQRCCGGSGEEQCPASNGMVCSLSVSLAKEFSPTATDHTKILFPSPSNGSRDCSFLSLWSSLPGRVSYSALPGKYHSGHTMWWQQSPTIRGYPVAMYQCPLQQLNPEPPRKWEIWGDSARHLEVG